MAGEKKKAAIVKRILKWIGLGLLALLLIAALIFQAPWKVITLLLIFLFACTILPKQMRKWFWLSAGTVVIALIIWVFLPDRKGDWKPYTFGEELAAIEAACAIPDEENAATIYNELLDRYDSNSFYAGLPESELKKVPMREPWLRGEHPEIAEWLEKHQTTISMLLNASKIEKCRFPINADVVSIGYTIDRLGPMRKWAYLLISAANNDMAESRIDQALEKNIAVIQMGNHQCQQPTILDMLTGFAVEALALRQFNRFIVTGDATEEHLTIIEKALTEIRHDWSYDFPRILDCEKLMAKNFWAMLYEANLKGTTRLSRNPWAAPRAWLEEQLEANQIKDQETIEFLKSVAYPTYWQRKLVKAATILGWFFLPSTPQKAAKIIDASYEKCYAMAEPDYDWQKEPDEPKEFSLTSVKFNFRFMTEMLVSIIEPAYHRIHDHYSRLYANRKGSRIIIALRRYKNETGHWPETLADVKSLAPKEIFVDPINGSSFIYKLTEENFKLYSKGKNNIDENGEYNSIWDPNSCEHKVEEDDRLIWPPKSRKTQQKNADDEQQ